MVFNCSICGVMVLRFLKLAQICCNGKFTFLFWSSHTHFKFASVLLQIYFKFAPRFALKILTALQKLLQFISENFSDLSIIFKFIAEANYYKMKQNLETIPFTPVTSLYLITSCHINKNKTAS